MFSCKRDTPCERKIIQIIISTGTVAFYFSTISCLLYPSGSRHHDISGRTCQRPKDTNCQKSQKAVWRYDFKEVLLEVLLLVRQLFYLVLEWKQSESYPTIYQKSRNKIKSGCVRTHLSTPMRCSCSYGRGTLLSFYRFSCIFTL